MIGRAASIPMLLHGWVWRFSYRRSAHIRRFVLEERLGELDLKPHDAGILRILKSNPGLTQEALSARLGAFPSRLVGMLDGLERSKALERRRGTKDRRSYQLYLTRTGRSMYAAIEQLTRQLEKELFADLSKKEKKALVGMLTALVTQQEITPGVHPAYSQMG